MWAGKYFPKTGPKMYREADKKHLEQLNDDYKSLTCFCKDMSLGSINLDS